MYRLVGLRRVLVHGDRLLFVFLIREGAYAT